MNKTLKNLLLILGLVTVGYGGYYLYSSRATTAQDTGINDFEYQAMLIRTHEFIQHRQELSTMQFNTNVFENEVFTNLQSNTRPLDDVEAGRSNPFAQTGN